MFPKWVVFYDDGSIFSNLDGDPWEAPATGVIVLLQIDGDGKWVQYFHKDTYCWGWRDQNEWVFCDPNGVQDYLFNYRGPKAILFGRWTSNENFEMIRRRADAYWRDHGTE